MEWLGAMFKGIGDTFTAGSNVHLGQMKGRENAENIKLERDALDSEQQMAQFDFLNQSAKNQFNMQVLIVAAIVILITVSMIFKK